MYEEVPPPEPEEPKVSQMPLMRKGPQDSYVERDMTNTEIRYSLSVLTKLMTTQAQIVTNHEVAYANLGVGPHPQLDASTSICRILHLIRMNP